MRIITGIFVFILISCSESKSEGEFLTKEDDSAGAEDVVLEEEVTFDPLSFQKTTEIPDLEFKGTMLDAWTWKDAKGIHYLIHSKNATDYEVFPRSEYLYSYHYVESDSGFELVRLVQDFEETCDFDITCEFSGDPVVTDLDENGLSEVTICYKLSCRSDMSENEMKIIMHDEKGKYGLRGYQYFVFPGEEEPEEGFEFDRSKMSPSDDWGFSRGRYANQNDFKNAPSAFFEQAETIWKTHAIVTF